MLYNKIWKVEEQLLPDEYRIKAQGDVQALDTKKRRAQQRTE